MKTMKTLITLGVVALLAVACGGGPKEKSGTVQEVQDTVEVVKAYAVKVMTLEQQVISIKEEYTADIEAYDKVYLAPTMPGRIEDVKVEVNDKVRRGQLIVAMDDANLEQTKVQLESLKKDKQRLDSLIVYGSVSQQAYDQLETQLKALETSYENLKANTRVLSPFNGIVTDRFFDDNEVFSAAPNTQAGKSAIVIIEQIEKLKVKVNVSARYFHHVEKGLMAELVTDIIPNEVFEGKVSLVYPTIDPMTRTFKVEVTIANPDLMLRPGMYAKVNVKLGEKEALVVPASVVMMQEGTANRYIFVKEGDAARQVPVVLGERFDDKLEIVSEENLIGKQVIVAGQSKLANGDLLEVIE